MQQQSQRHEETLRFSHDAVIIRLDPVHENIERACTRARESARETKTRSIGPSGPKPTAETVSASRGPIQSRGGAPEGSREIVDADSAADGGVKRRALAQSEMPGGAP